MDKDLAEVAGAFAGDGSLYANGSGYLFEIRGPKNELPYYEILKPKFEKILKIELKIVKRSYNGGYVIGLRSGKRIVYDIFHKKLGFPVGSKSRIVKVPKIIFSNEKLWIYYLRGVFDTDGSIYLRKAGRKMRQIQPVVDICSLSVKHLKQINFMLKGLGFSSWMEKTKVRMAGKSTLERFFKTIKPNNNKHHLRYRRFAGIA